MPTRLQVIAPVAAAAFVVGIIGMLSLPTDAKIESTEFPRGMVKVDDVVLEVQIADTEPRRVRGLMFQDQLPYDQGMLFVFDAPGVYSLWMINMEFSLDMIWFDRDGQVVHIEQNVEPCRTAVETLSCPSKIPNREASYVLEVTAGFVDNFGITNDSMLEIISI